MRSLSRTSVAIAADGRRFRDCRRLHYGRIVPGTVVQWLDQTLQADIYVSPPQTTANRVLGKLDPMIVDALKTWDGIRQVVTYNDANVQIVNFNHQAKLISAGDVSQGKRPYAWIRPDLSDPWNALAAGKGVISEALILRENLHSIPERSRWKPRWRAAFPVLAIFYDYSSDQGTIILDNDLYESLWHDLALHLWAVC